MIVQFTDIEPGLVFESGSTRVRVAENYGLNAGLRLDQEPPTGLVHAPWFRGKKEVAEFLNLGGHATGTPFQLIMA
jgi:hypothetical protein